MNAAADRLEFAPPPTAGLMRSLVLALLAHGLLVAALTWGVHWRREAEPLSAEAELWASVPVAAAPKLEEPPPQPPVVETPKPKPLPEPEPVVQPPKVDIALEREKQRKLKQREIELQQEKLKAEKVKLEKAKLDKINADKLKQELADKTKREQQKKQDALQAKQLEAQRQKNLQRMAGLAGATGDPGATGSAMKSAGPSASYAGRIRARIKPNIVFTEAINGDPVAEVEVHTSPDGTIVARKLLKSSGNKAWDDAVLKAIDKTAVLPRDTDGRVPPVLEISFKPKD